MLLPGEMAAKSAVLALETSSRLAASARPGAVSISRTGQARSILIRGHLHGHVDRSPARHEGQEGQIAVRAERQGERLRPVRPALEAEDAGGCSRGGSGIEPQVAL